MVFTQNSRWVPSMRIMTCLTLDQAIFADFSVPAKQWQLGGEPLVSGRDVHGMRIVFNDLFPRDAVFIVAADTEILWGNAIFSDSVPGPQEALVGPVHEVATPAES